MQTITTTELRTKTKKLVEALKAGKTISVIHRSEVIGSVKPNKQIYTNEAPPVNIKELKKFFSAIKPNKLIPRKDREKIYRKRLEKKYGSSVS